MNEKYQPRYGHPGGPLRDSEFRDAFEHRGLKVPFDLEAAGLNADKLYEMGFEYEQHSDGAMSTISSARGPYRYTLGFWFDPKDDWREAKLRAAGRLQ